MIDPIGTEIIDVATAGAAKTLRQKIANSVFRLIAGGPGFHYVDQIRHNENTIEGKKKIDALVAEEVARQAILDPDFMDRAKARFLGETYRKQENIEAVASMANAQINESPDCDEVTGDVGTEPSDDWMNAFIREAEAASSVQLRDRLARVLAGETRKPGTYSRATVRMIAELEKETLDNFQSLKSHVFGNLIIIGKECPSGKPFERALMLETEGLITGASGSTSHQLTIGPNGSAGVTGRRLSVVFQGDVGVKISFAAYILTRTGSELVSLMEMFAEESASEHLAEAVEKNGLNEIWVGPYQSLADGQFTAFKNKLLWKKSEALQ